MNLTRRALGVFTAPRSVFEFLRDQPKWLDVFLLFMVVNALLFLPMAPMIQQQSIDQGRESIEKNTNLSEEQMAEAIDRQESFMRGPVYQAITWASIVIILPLMFLFWALLIWVAFGFMVGGDIGFKQAWAATCHCSLILLLGGALKLPLALVKNSMHVALSPAILLPEMDPSSVAYAALDSFDIFSLWTFGALAAGMTAMANISEGKARTATIGLFILTLGLRVGGAAIGAMMNG